MIPPRSLFHSGIAAKDVHIIVVEGKSKAVLIQLGRSELVRLRRAKLQRKAAAAMPYFQACFHLIEPVQRKGQQGHVWCIHNPKTYSEQVLNTKSVSFAIDSLAPKQRTTIVPSSQDIGSRCCTRSDIRFL